MSCQTERGSQIPTSDKFNFCAIAFFRFPCHFLCYKKNGGQSSGRQLSRCKKRKKKYRETLHPAGSRGASGPGLGARWPAGGRAERRQSPASSGTEGSVSPLRLCTRWVGVGSHCGQRKWLPKGAGRLPAVCRAEKSVAQIGKKKKKKNIIIGG